MRHIGKKRHLTTSPLSARLKRAIFPVTVGTALFLTYPTLVAHQDVAKIFSAGQGIDPSIRWLASVTPPPGVSSLVTGSIASAAAAVPPAQAASQLQPRLSTQIRTERRPQTVNRTLKGDRVVSTTFVRPPESFNAGRVYDRHSMLQPFRADQEFERAFVKAKPIEEAIKVASVLHLKSERPDPLAPSPDLPVMVASLVKESAPNVLAYAPEPSVRRSPFAAVLGDDTPINLIPRLDRNDHAWAADPLPKSVYSEREQHCLTAGIYFEARGEPVRGQAAVSQVILNRVRNPSYPDTICGVVYQNDHWRNRCQFSFACDRIPDKVRDSKRWELAQYVARETTEGRIWLKEVGSSTHYHATYVSPKWARSMKRVGRIGLHIFYRTFGGGWS